MNKSRWIISMIVFFVLMLAAGCANNGGDEYNAAVTAVRKGDYSEAAKLFGVAIRRNREQPEYYISYGTALIQMERYGEASSSYLKAMEFSEGKDENIKRCYRGLGISYYFQKKWDTAESYLKNAINFEELPELNIECYSYLGALNDETGDVEEAYDAYCNVLKIKPETFPAIVGKYRAEVDLKMKKEAKATLKSGLENIPETAEDQYLYAMLQFYDEDYKGAKQELLKAAESYNEAYIFLGQIMVTENKYDDAIKYFEAYIQRTGDEENLTVYTMLSKCYISKFQYKEALKNVKKGLMLPGNDEEFQTLRYNPVTIYENMEKFKKALSYATEYSGIYPEDVRFSEAKTRIEGRMKINAQNKPKNRRNRNRGSSNKNDDSGQEREDSPE